MRLRRIYTASGKAWGIKRKFSEIKALRKSKEKEPAVMALPFPERVEAVAGKDSVDATQSRQRQEAAQTWMNAVLELSPGDTDLAAFFAHDGSVRASYAQDVLGVSVSAAELAADKAGGDRRAGEALREAMAATKMSDVESQPDRVVISEAVKKQGDEEKRTQTEVYMVYRMTVFAPDGEEWVIEKRFSAFKALREKLLADGNPAVRSMTFPESAFLGSVQGQGMDDEVISKRKEMLDVWINEVLLFCPGNSDVGKFLQNPTLAEAEAKAKAEFEAAAKAAKAEKLKAQDDELNYHPNKVELLVIRVDGDIEDPAYIMKCTTPANEIWPIARRYSSFVQLQKDLIATGNPAVKGIFFPHKKMFSSFTSSFGSFFGSKAQPSGGSDSSESRERKEQLQAWIDEVVDLCPGDKLVSMFLAKDGSVSVDLAKQLGINLGVADEAAEQRKAAGKAMELEKERAAASSKLQSMDQMPSKISIVKAITRQGDPDQKTQTEIFTAYWVKVFLPDSDETWVVEKRFQAFKTLRAKLLADGNPAIRSTEFPPSTALGSITGQGLDVEVVHKRKRLLESWLNEVLLVCCGDADLAQFLDRSLAIPDAELNIPDDFEIVMVNPKEGVGDLYGKGGAAGANANDEDSSGSDSDSSDSDTDEEQDAAVATAAMATAIGESGATVQRSIYVCASKTKIRSGFAMDSTECGVLEEGQRVEALGYKVNQETGITRVAIGSASSSQPVCKGWVNEKSGAGSVILAVAPPLSYSVDEGGAVAYRNTPRMADRHQGAKAQPSEIIQVGERRISIGDGAADGEWVQNKANKLWLPVRFLVPQGAAPTGATTPRASTPASTGSAATASSSAASAESARAERVARLAMQEKAAAEAKAKAASATSPSKLQASSAASLEQSAKLKEAEAKAQADGAREKKEQEERERAAAAAAAAAEAAEAAAAAEAARAKAKEDEEDAIMARMLGTTGSDDEGTRKPQQTVGPSSSEPPSLPRECSHIVLCCAAQRRRCRTCLPAAQCRWACLCRM
eukprot:COSAG02_NODE_650_length_18912_cov_23.728698_10_plen_1024_part_00